jgi:hypothetical protein
MNSAMLTSLLIAEYTANTLRILLTQGIPQTNARIRASRIDTGVVILIHPLPARPVIQNEYEELTLI